MTNRFDRENPARGLSKLQKAMLVWILEDSERMRKWGYKRPFAVWHRRPQWYGKPAHLFGWRPRTWYAETPAVSRALKRLVERGLVAVTRPSHTRRYVRLTSQGREVTKQLVEDGITSRYHKQDRDGAKNLLAALSQRPVQD